MVLALVLVLAAVSSAVVVDVVAVGVGSNGHAGTQEDPLDIGECIEIMVVLTHNPYPFGGGDYYYYDGNILFGLGADLTVTNGTLGTTTFPSGNPKNVLSDMDEMSWTLENDVLSLSGISLGGVDGSSTSNRIARNLLVCCDGPGDMVISLVDTAIDDPQIPGIPDAWAPYKAGGPLGDVQEFEITQADLGSLTIYQVPEPMTMGLLGLGGLFLRRRK